MSLARKKQKMELEYGRKVSRGEIWITTHKHANGEFVNEEAKQIREKIEAYELSGNVSKDISSQDSLAQTLGSQEHCRRVRGLGLGPCPSHLFGHTIRSSRGISSSSPSYRELQNEVSKVLASLDSQKYNIEWKPLNSRSRPLVIIRWCSIPIAPSLLLLHYCSSSIVVPVVILLWRFFSCGFPFVFLQSYSASRVRCLSWYLFSLTNHFSHAHLVYDGSSLLGLREGVVDEEEVEPEGGGGSEGDWYKAIVLEDIVEVAVLNLGMRPTVLRIRLRLVFEGYSATIFLLSNRSNIH
ncbi:hypothetical protein Fmac_012223 [Flemingia macrophylla]|uniref:Uncharacterized protein n=1 Tax=Flemingia macrophylla TaxID=520843 RepID=A0ABD1MPN1_9FABA